MANAKTTAFRHGNKSMISITIDTEQVESLDELATRRRTSRAALIRESIDLYLASKSVTEPEPAHAAA